MKDKNISNYEENEGILKESNGITDLADFNIGKSIILVAAGPSLNKNIRYLKAAYRKIPILCVDAAFPILLKNKIEPDIVFIVDTKPVQEIFFRESYPGIRTKLAAASCVHKKVIEAWKGEFYFFNAFGSDEDHEIQLKHGKDFGSLGVGGNVSSAVLWFSIAFSGSSRIIFVGHDFSYQNIQNYYARGTVDEMAADKKKRLPTWDIYGKTVFQDLSLKSYKEWTERTIRDLKTEIENLGGKIEFINCTEGGTLGTTPEPNILLPYIEQKILKEEVERTLFSEYRTRYFSF
jgi:hypothetical protein